MLNYAPLRLSSSCPGLPVAHFSVGPECEEIRQGALRTAGKNDERERSGSLQSEDDGQGKGEQRHQAKLACQTDDKTCRSTELR